MKTKIGASSAGAGAAEGGLERGVDVMSLMAEESVSGSLGTNIPDPVKRQKQVSAHFLHTVEVICERCSQLKGCSFFGLPMCSSCVPVCLALCAFVSCLSVPYHCCFILQHREQMILLSSNTHTICGCLCARALVIRACESRRVHFIRVRRVVLSGQSVHLHSWFVRQET